MTSPAPEAARRPAPHSRGPASKRLLPFLALLLAALAAHAPARPHAAPGPAGGGFGGEWNWAVYATDRGELPPAYKGMRLEQVPANALDVTIRQRGSRLTGECGALAHFLSRVDGDDFTATVRNGTAQFTLGSGFGGTATVRLTLRGDTLHWKVVRRRGVSYYPQEVVLRRLRPGETPPYVEKEDGR